MTKATPQTPGRTSLLSRLAIAVSLLAALWGCGNGGGEVGADQPPMVQEPPTATEVEGTLSRLLKHAVPPKLWSFGGAVATCEAIGCPVHDAVHIDHVPRVDGLDFSGFDFIGRRRSVSLATSSQSFGMGDHFVSRRTLGGWMDYSFFLVETTHEGRYADFSYRTHSIGNARPANPAVSVSGTWSGVMAGVFVSFSEDDGAFVRGDAAITVAYPGGSGAALVNVEFTSITREDTGPRIGNMTWVGLALEGGKFGTGFVLHNHGDARYLSKNGYRPSPMGSIFGQFHGPNHEEAGGLFHRDGIAGALGATRNN